MRHAGVRQVVLRYEVQGPVDASVVFVAGGISAHRHVSASEAFPEAGWANSLVGLKNGMINMLLSLVNTKLGDIATVGGIAVLAIWHILHLRI